MLVRSLASNYLKRTLRSPFGAWILGGNLLMVLCFWAPIFLYAFYMGFSVVRFLEIDRSVDLLAHMNPVLLPGLMIWGLVDGMLLRRKMGMSLFPYLATPTPRRTLALFYQIVMLFGKFNLFVLAFIAGFWVKNLYLRDIAFAWNWLLVLCLAYVCMHFTANILRSWRGRGYLPLLGIWLCVAVLAVLEWGYEARLLSKASVVFFNAAAEGAVWPSILLAVSGVFLFFEATRRISRSFYTDYSATPRALGKRRAFRRRRKPRSLTAELLSCEWKLMLRNRQPRMMAVASAGALLCTAFVVGALSGEVGGVSHFAELGLLYVLFYPFSYFSSALDFRHSFYDGLNVWPISENALLRTLLSMSHRGILILVLSFILSIMSISIAFGHPVHFAWIFIQGILLFSIGISNYIALLLDVLFPAPRPPNAGMMEPNILLMFIVNTHVIFINLCFVIALLLPFIVSIIQPVSGVWLGVPLGVLGLAGLCFQPWLTRLLARLLRARRYVVMGRFRVW